MQKFRVTKRDKLEVLRVFLSHYECEVSMITLLKGCSYSKNRYIKEQKICRIVAVLEKELNYTVRCKIIRKANNKFKLRFL